MCACACGRACGCAGGRMQPAEMVALDKRLSPGLLGGHRLAMVKPVRPFSDSLAGRIQGGRAGGHAHETGLWGIHDAEALSQLCARAEGWRTSEHTAISMAIVMAVVMVASKSAVIRRRASNHRATAPRALRHQHHGMPWHDGITASPTLALPGQWDWRAAALRHAGVGLTWLVAVGGWAALPVSARRSDTAGAP
ncbi:hypothetical protein BS50DRAFT_653664, partial [Corynespora cassiicola Philippines]